jgi:hypothetical protein
MESLETVATPENRTPLDLDEPQDQQDQLDPRNRLDGMPPVMSEVLPHAEGERQNNHIEVQLPVLRESTLAKVFPLSDVFVTFPTARPNFLKSTMFYKIDFVWRGEERSVVRRFSEIQNFREALQSLLPFSFIFPTHRKQLLVT